METISSVAKLYIDHYVHKHYDRILGNMKMYKLIIKSAQEVQRLVPAHCDETAFSKALEYELGQYGRVVRERYIPIFYKGLLIQQLRLDLEFEGFIVELKTLEKLHRKNEMQLRAYIHHTEYRKGVLINFNTKTHNLDYFSVYE